MFKATQLAFATTLNVDRSLFAKSAPGKTSMALEPAGE